MLIPEIILHYTIKTVLDVVKQDWEENTDKSKTILADFLDLDDNGMVLQVNKFNYLEQGSTIFLKGGDSSRKISVNVGYNTERAGLPTIHILLPSESEEEKGLGMGEGYQDDYIYEEAGVYKSSYTNVYRSNYSLLLTSDNSSEVVLMYHFFKNFIFAILEHLEHSGLRDVKISGQDLQLSTDLLPQNIYHRNISLNFFYESSVRDVVKKKLAKSLKFTGITTQTNY